MEDACQVCSGKNPQNHFGANVCRACASFFRRFVNTKKAAITCNCYAKRESQYPCRLCRMKKCRAVGMQESKVQGPRDGMNTVRRRRMVLTSSSTSSSPYFSNSFSSSSSPEAPSIQFGIKLRSLDRLYHSLQTYGMLETTRKSVFEGIGPESVSMYELSLEAKTDSKLLWKLCEMAFSEFNELSRNDKQIIFFNFYTKWLIWENCMFSTKRKKQVTFFSPSGAEAKSMNKFYVESLKEKDSMSEEDVQRIFEPYWNFQLENVVRPVVQLGFGDMENMAMFGLMLWDAGYANVNEELGEVCRAMRKVICRELSSYFEEKDDSSGKLFFQTLDTLNLIERAENKCQEEMQLMGIYEVVVDEDVKNMIMWQKY